MDRGDRQADCLSLLLRWNLRLTLTESEKHLLEGIGGVPLFQGEFRVEPALFHRCREEPESCSAQCPVRRCELCQDVVAVASVIDHGLEASQLTLDSFESLDDVISVIV